MRKVIILIINVLPCLMMGQYTYFNTYMPAPNLGTVGGICGHLFVRDSTLWTHGMYNDFSNFQQTNYQLSLEGELLQQVDYDLPNLGFQFIQYADAAELQPDGTVLSAVGYEDANQNLFPKVVSYNQDWTVSWSFELHVYDDDEFAITPDYHFVLPMNDGSYVAAGNVGMDTLNEPGYTSGDFIMTRFLESGEIIWHKHYAFHTGSILSFAPTASKTSCIFEMANGDLLVWGAWYADWDPMVVRFDAAGNFISEHHWGSPEYDDWLPWPVPVSDSTFLFASSYGTGFTSEFGPIYTKPSVGLFNSNTMSVEWVEVFEYEYYGSFIADFEKLDDDTYVLAGYGYDGITMGFVYMMAFDAQGNELWFHKYYPPIAHFTPEVSDLEITPDGGLAFAGNFFRADENNNPVDKLTWIVKTDACGEEVFNGCTSAVAELAIEKSTLKIAPNPASNSVNISSEEEIKSITIRDITGKIVLQQQMNNHQLQTQLDVSALATGLYLIEANFGNNKVVAQRLIKQE